MSSSAQQIIKNLRNERWCHCQEPSQSKLKPALVTRRSLNDQRQSGTSGDVCGLKFCGFHQQNSHDTVEVIGSSPIPPTIFERTGSTPPSGEFLPHDVRFLNSRLLGRLRRAISLNLGDALQVVILFRHSFPEVLKEQSPW